MSFVNSLEFVVGFIGTGATRAISAPLNPAYTTPEVEFYLKDTNPVLLLLPQISDLPPGSGAAAALQAAINCGVRTGELVIEGNGRVSVKVIHTGRSTKSAKRHEEKISPKPSDIALVLHTSGTTGRPKSVPLSHHNLLTTCGNVVRTYDLAPTDRGYLVMPLFHVHGLLAGLLTPLSKGASVVVPPKFSAAHFWKDFVAWGCNWYTAVPTIHMILLNTPVPNPLPKIKFIRSCSASLPPVIFERLESTFHAPVLEAYAMTEAAHQISSNVPATRLAGTVGLGIGTEISIRDDRGREVPQGAEGEVCVRGENVTQGYWANDAANAEAFWEGRWFRTGDQGLILPTPPHSLRLTGRIKELINRGGEKISPLEIDAALLALKSVSVKEAVAFGVEDPKYGEIVWAGVVLADESVYRSKAKREAAEKELKRELEGKIAKFKIPERIIITPSIPKTATGKIQRRHIKVELVKLAREQGEHVKGDWPKAKL
ncbi:hypothetical protein BOTBODRAFT_38511 [Botryobasidium botryosum FD-172 SS1]|uniref:AMP-dependent synthetase/ligase domain-containing protein n=1 Tax=Botryobasidium botryosum (strain FD-172 SS1) TaxID=930990 RepID=A0A067LWV9_BOTB1|nr:hypothetical protein BOTBODRAFT_38511 [Botryobasidium botryosum FD-172 SS1]